MPRFVSGARAVYATHDTTAVWNPLTGAVPARSLKSVRFGVWLGGVTQLKVQPGFQFSDDGVDWSGTYYGKPMQAAGKDWTSAPDWTWGDFTTWTTVEEAGGGSKAYVRFGVVALNTAAGLPTQSAEARVQVEAKPEYTGTSSSAPTRVYTKNDNDFVPLTGAIPAVDVGNVRAELELSGVGTTSLSVQAGWQQVDDPGVDTDWGTATAFGTVRTSDGYYAAGSYTSATVTRQYVRFGVKVTQASGTDVRSCIVRARFDWRA